MSEYRTQKELKPKVQDIAEGLLSEDKLENVLDFLVFLKANKLTPRWYTTDSWVIKYKNKKVCQIKLNWVPRPSDKENFWGIYCDHFTRQEWLLHYEGNITDDGLKEFIWNNINPPYGCNKKEGRCKGWSDIKVLDKNFKAICGCFPLVIKNPNGKTLAYAKEYVLIVKDFIADLAV
ncbi:MAG: hypothetical protein FWE06_08785 [Oscillospiraceae bacterium]|nr:hypothetical protein [Oscillospiraceae bacterium]